MFCATYLLQGDNVITPTLNTPTLNTPTVITLTLITPTLNTSTVTDSLCNSGAFSNPNAVRDCPFNLKGAWFLSQSWKFFSYAALLFLNLFSATQQNMLYKRRIGREYSAKVAFSIFQSLKRIQSLPVRSKLIQKLKKRCFKNQMSVIWS